MKDCIALVAILGIVFPLGCATPTPEQCDPRTGGFLGGLWCFFAGGYDVRIGEKERSLEQVEAELASKRGELEQAKADRKQVAEERAAREAQAAQARRQLAELERRLASGQKNNLQLQRQAQALRHELAGAENAIPGLTAVEEEKAARLDRLRTEMENLEREAEAMQSDRLGPGASPARAQ